MLLLPPPGRQSNYPPIFPQEKEKTFFSSRTFLTRRSPCATLPAGSSHLLLATHPRPLYHPPLTSLSAASHKQKKCGPAALRREPAHHVCQTCSKKRRLPAQESTRRHARLTRSCFGRKNLFIDDPHSPLPFFLSPFLQGKEKRKQK